MLCRTCNRLRSRAPLTIAVAYPKTGRKPQVCHIVPFSANSKDKKRAKYQQLLETTAMFLFPQDSTTNESPQKLFASSVGVRDREWNMGSLNSQLHKWWSEFHFGLQVPGHRAIDHSHAKIANTHYHERRKLMISKWCPFIWIPARPVSSAK
jgi:hypothetical protein